MKKRLLAPVVLAAVFLTGCDELDGEGRRRVPPRERLGVKPGGEQGYVPRVVRRELTPEEMDAQAAVLQGQARLVAQQADEVRRRLEDQKMAIDDLDARFEVGELFREQPYCRSPMRDVWFQLGRTGPRDPAEIVIPADRFRVQLAHIQADCETGEVNLYAAQRQVILAALHMEQSAYAIRVRDRQLGLLSKWLARQPRPASSGAGGKP
jgi:hypothetical protein